MQAFPSIPWKRFSTTPLTPAKLKLALTCFHISCSLCCVPESRHRAALRVHAPACKEGEYDTQEQAETGELISSISWWQTRSVQFLNESKQKFPVPFEML